MSKIDEPKPDRDGRSGLTVHDASRACPGYTLCWSKGSRSARLIDMDGEEFHRWTLDRGPTWHWCDMLENGHLLVVANEKAYSTRHNIDARLWELNWDGKVVWSDPGPVHHDARRLVDGNTLAVCNGHAVYPDISHEPKVYDYIQEITPENEVVWEWHFAAHADELEAEEAKNLPAGHNDWPHINTVEELPDTPLGQRDARFRAGNVLVSPRHMHCIFIIGRESGRVVWSWGRGEILGQHQPTMLPDGDILMFDNGHGPPERGRSRVIEIEPDTGKIVWQWPDDPGREFWSPVGSGAQRLPNGNTLICAMNWGDAGRIFEVTPDGAIVWDYWNPEGVPFYRATRFIPETVEDLLQ